MTSAPVHVLPDAKGRFGAFGGRYVPETLVAPLEELEAAYAAAREDGSFQAELNTLLRTFAGRPTPLQYASGRTENLSEARGPAAYRRAQN
jgi:tryptophan synthase beta chain